MALFRRGVYQLASGQQSSWKIECDDLEDEDWETLAYLIASRARPFGSVASVPSGGDKLAAALQSYRQPGVLTRLLVDDVYSTGSSIEKYRMRNDEVWVVFARKKPTSNVNALFVME